MLIETKQNDLLTWLGDQLDATDEVREQNGIGFNKFDKGTWRHVRGNEDAMKKLLAKYMKQLSNRFGNDTITAIDWTTKQAMVVVAVDNFGYTLKLETVIKLDRDIFMEYVNYVKKTGGRFANYLWSVPKNYDFDALRAHLDKYNIAVSDIPTGEKPQQYGVYVSKSVSGLYQVNHAYCEKLNAAYRNAEETSGVLGFDWDTKARLIGKDQIEDLDEMLGVIRNYYPTWTVKYDFDIEAERARLAAEKNALRFDDVGMQSLLNEGMKPLPYQLEGFKYYVKFNGCALNGDDMGLGKTFQTLMYAAHAGLKTVVVCPKNVRRQWLQEAKKFFKDGIFQGLEINSLSKLTSLVGYNLVTINYEIVDKFYDLLANAGFNLLVIDESHRIKNPDAKTTKRIVSLAEKFAHRICLSGTPIKNKKQELFTQANLIAPKTFKSEGEVIFSRTFDVREKLKNFFFRRTKKQELKDLPEKLRSIVSIEAKGRRMPDLFAGCLIGDIASIKSSLAQAKTPYTIDFVDDILDNTDSKVIVFSDSDDAASAIAKYFGERAVLHIGATSHEKREVAKITFNDETSKVRVFAATTGSAREGLNLTVADKVVFNDLPWTPADLNQAEARAHRLGQKNCVNVYWMQVDRNEFDTRSVEIIKNKMRIYEALINGKKLTEEEQAVMKKGLISDLLEKP